MNAFLVMFCFCYVKVLSSSNHCLQQTKSALPRLSVNSVVGLHLIMIWSCFDSCFVSWCIITRQSTKKAGVYYWLCYKKNYKKNVKGVAQGDKSYLNFYACKHCHVYIQVVEIIVISGLTSHKHWFQNVEGNKKKKSIKKKKNQHSHSPHHWQRHFHICEKY